MKQTQTSLQFCCCLENVLTPWLLLRSNAQEQKTLCTSICWTQKEISSNVIRLSARMAQVQNRCTNSTSLQLVIAMRGLQQLRALRYLSNHTARNKSGANVLAYINKKRLAAGSSYLEFHLHQAEFRLTANFSHSNCTNSPFFFFVGRIEPECSSSEHAGL